MRPAAAVGLVLVLTMRAGPAFSQDASVVEAMAPMLQAEDARQWAPTALKAGVESPEPLVRKTAALSIGRIGDLRGTALVVPLLVDRDSTVQEVAAFALGLLRDTAAVPALANRLGALPAPTLATATEIVSALARIGGPAAATTVNGVLDNTASVSLTSSRDVLVRQAALESWRLGDRAAVRQLVSMVETADDELRWRVVFSLAQLRTPQAASAFLNAVQDKHALVRMYAAQGLRAPTVRAANLDATGVIQLLSRAAEDEQASVRIAALRSLGSFRQPGVGDVIAAQLNDAVPNVQVAAATAAADAGGPVAVAQLSRIVRDRKGSFAVQREALLGLARISADSFRSLAGPWTSSSRWPERATAAEGWGWVAPGPVVEHPDFFADPDGRVAAAALQGWSEAVTDADPAIMAAARRLLSHPDVGVRTLAAEVVGRAPAGTDLAPLTAAYEAGTKDSVPDAAIAALAAIRRIGEASEEGSARVSMDFIATTPRPGNYVIRLWAEAAWPTAARRWGPAFPIRTSRTLEDYRELARRFVAVPESPDAYPHVYIETEQRGLIEIELFGPEAPLTVLNFLTLLDRRFYDHGRWHRVIPGLIVRDGDPRGDGWGGPDYAIRDEINRRRFDGYVLAMALAGPDTGGSQFFLTLGQQPQLDGRYTVFGRVVGTPNTLLRVTEGDQIMLIRR